jgi:hypothetical protein
MSSSLQPAIKAPLDPGFLPAVLFNRHYVQTARASGQAVPLVLGLARECGLVRLPDDGTCLRQKIRGRPNETGKASRGQGHASRRRRPSQGCRIGFDLGASDYKVSAVADGDAIASSWPEFGNAARFSKRKDRVNIFAGWPA